MFKRKVLNSICSKAEKMSGAMMKKIKSYLLKKLGILSLREKYNEEEKQVITLQKRLNDVEKRLKDLRDVERRLNDLTENKAELMYRVRALEELVFLQTGGLEKEKREQKLIVSMTSFPARIEAAAKVVKQMMIQTIRPDEIILWLSEEQFPEKEKQLPQELLDLRGYGLTIGWCQGDMKAYKKFLPAMKAYPEDLIMIIDDDLVYPVDFVEKLYEAHQHFPDGIIASRVHEIGLDEQGKIAPYGTWKKQCSYDRYQTRDDWFFTGGAGTLFPPHVFDEELFDEALIKEICPWADDIWLNVHAAINHVPIVNTALNHKLARIDGTQEECLQKINWDRNENDIQLHKVVDRYKTQLKDTIYARM